MAFLDKLKFWKKKDTLDLGTSGDELSLGADNLGFGSDQMGLPKQETPATLSSPRLPDQQATPQLSGFGSPIPQQQLHETGMDSRDRELMMAKLDTIKALLDSIDHRMAIIEQREKQKELKRSRYEYV